MKKIIIPVFIGIILLMPLILPNGFALHENSHEGIFPLDEVGDNEIIVAFTISAVSLAVIIGIFSKLSRKSLIEIIWNDKKLPTLSKFQFLLWTIVIAFTYLSIQIIIVIGTDYSGDYVIGNVPENLLALMGISVTVPIVNAYIKEEDKHKNLKNGKFFGVMFHNSKGDLDLARLQMFLWTIIGIAIFLFTVFDQMLTVTTIDKLFLPDVSPTLLILMGLSQTAYLGTKIAKRVPSGSDSEENDSKNSNNS